MASGDVASDIRRFTDREGDQYERTLAVLLQGHHHDNATAALSGQDPKVRDYMFRKMLSFVLKNGHCYIAVSGNDIIGAALWIPPGVDCLWWNEPDFVRLLKPDVQEWFAEHYGPLYKALYKSPFPANDNIRRDSWWLHVLSVVPGSRHKGVGKALISVIARREEAMIAEARDLNAITFLQKCGFKHIAVKNVACTNSPGFPMFLMYKEAT